MADGSIRVSDGFDERAVPRRTLAGATILQIVPALHEEPAARSAVNVAHVLLRAGARALIAADGGPLVERADRRRRRMDPDGQCQRQSVRGCGAMRARSKQLIGQERVDIVHAYDAGAAWSARIAAAQIAVWLVTTLPDVPSYTGMRGRYAGALAQGDRIIAPSNYAAAPIIERYGVRAEQITIVPRVIDTATYDPAAVSPERVDALRAALARRVRRPRSSWCPGRVAPWNGQILLPEIARTLVDERRARISCSSSSAKTRRTRKYARDVLKRAQSHGRRRPVPHGRTLRRHAGGVRRRRFRRGAGDRAAAARPRGGAGAGDGAAGRHHRRRRAAGTRGGAAADAGGRAHRLGGDAPAIRPTSRRRSALALSLDDAAYRGMSARARQFAEYMFSPESVADAMRSVYTSLLARDHLASGWMEHRSGPRFACRNH